MTTDALDHKTFIARLEPDRRASLTALSDGPGLIRLLGHGGLILGLGIAIAAGVPGWPLLVPLQGVLLAFLFTLQHECTHRTPFRTGFLNEIMGHATGFLILQPFLWFRYFHMAHHKHTNDPLRDPELRGVDKPQSLPGLLWHLATPGYWWDKACVLALNAMGRVEGDYVPEAARARVVREARIMVVGYAGAVLAMALWPVLFWVWLLPLVIGFPVLRLYLLAEHGGCPPVSDMFQNTRTVLAGPAVRFLSWNMPYHAEHHAMPSVPFHKLPDLHGAALDHLGAVSASHLEFTKDYARHITAP